MIGSVREEVLLTFPSKEAMTAAKRRSLLSGSDQLMGMLAISCVDVVEVRRFVCVELCVGCCELTRRFRKCGDGVRVG